jgi:hypothetical protein
MENRPTSLLLLITQLLRHVTSSNAVDSEDFNIYEDYNLVEVSKAKEILQRFDSYVVQLLCEFEDHPALLQVFQFRNYWYPDFKSQSAIGILSSCFSPN